MKKASKVLLTIGGILHIVDGVSFIIASLYLLIAAITYFIAGTNWLMPYFEAEDAAEPLTITLIAVAVAFIVLFFVFFSFGIMSFFASKLTFNARESSDKKQLITSIVMAAILDNPPAVVGSIFALVVANKEKEEIKQVE